MIEDDRNLAPLSRWVKSTHDAGVPIWAQLNHPGRQSNPGPSAIGHTPVAPSAVPISLPGSPTPRALTGTEIESIIERFATAAAVCEAAGFDGVQIHGAHGYLVTQFLSPLTNLREDEWGGDSRRRMRFLLEVIRRIRARVSPGFAVSVNSADFQRGGFSEDDSREIVRALAGEAVDLIEISGGNYESPAMSGSAAASTRAREAYFLDYARSVRKAAGQVPLAVTGGFRSQEAMAQAVKSGDCDVVGLARPTVTMPDAADAILSGRIGVLPTHELRTGMRSLISRFVDVKALDGVLNISWNTDQLHRLGAGLDPDPDRGRLVTTLAMLKRNGTTTLRPTRGIR